MTTRPYDRCYTSADVRETADRLGSHMFSADNMRFYGSRLSDFHKPATPGTNPYGDSEGAQVGYVITSDRTTWGDDAPRGWMPRKYVIVRDENGRDSITFESIKADDDGGPDAGLNGWHRSKSRAIAAVRRELEAAQ